MYIYTYIYIYIYINISATVPLRHEVECTRVWGMGAGETAPLGILGIRETGPLGTGKLGKQDPKGTSREPPPSAYFFCVALRSTFLVIFLTSSWDPNFPDFGANLGPTWAQLGAKIDQKSLQEGSKSQPKLHLGFDALLDRFLIDFGCDFGAK